MTDEPRLTWAAIAPAIPFIGVGLVLLGARAVILGITEASVLLGALGALAVVVGAAVAWRGLRRSSRSRD